MMILMLMDGYRLCAPRIDILPAFVTSFHAAAFAKVPAAQFASCECLEKRTGHTRLMANLGHFGRHPPRLDQTVLHGELADMLVWRG
jgi:hypothetical protein